MEPRILPKQPQEEPLLLNIPLILPALLLPLAPCVVFLTILSHVLTGSCQSVTLMAGVQQSGPGDVLNEPMHPNSAVLLTLQFLSHHLLIVALDTIIWLFRNIHSPEAGACKTAI